MPNSTFDAAHAAVCQKIEQFQAGAATYLSSDYKEASARQDFIDPLFIALGWDVLHNTQIDPLQQEVKIERSVHMAEGRKSADYAFAVAPTFGRPRFFCEAKKPSKRLSNADNCFQAVRYGWNAKTPLAVLTDFEEIFVMDCRAKPELASATARILQKWHYTDLLDREKFGALYSLFGRDAVASGSLERYVGQLKKSPAGAGRQMRLFSVAAQPVDVEFLNQLEEWRAELAQSFKFARPSLDAAALTETTQRALDRLVFVRFLEDNLIETEERVSKWIDGDAWRNFRAEARDLDKKYNGVLWKKHPILDDPTFELRDGTWSKICFRISNRETPYLFNLIPIPILGSIYERFLGNEIELVKGKLGKDEPVVTPKPEVRKAGGVYYTPEYIVEYIVKHTVETQLDGKTPAQVAKMRFADIACGSGSFLLGVYDALLRWHTAYYAANPRDAKRDKCLETEDGVRLSLKQRRTILENNIWGADIDAQAVEVSKLSLYLKLLEDETANSARQFQLDFGERVLPDVDKNIVCGNSLVGFDILDDGTLTSEEEEKINPMDWQATFPEILRSGGFDAIVGNPPYGAELTPLVRKYASNQWNIGTTDTAALMMYQASKLLKARGINGFIVPKPFIYASNWEKTREDLLPQITEMVDVGKVWKKVKLEQVIYFLDKSVKSSTYKMSTRRAESITVIGTADKKQCAEFGFIFNGLSTEEIAIGEKIRKVGKPLSSFMGNTRGAMFQKLVVQTGKGTRVIGGANVQNEGLSGQKGIIVNTKSLPSQAFTKAGSILAQNIVAHIQNPTDHIKITACVVEDEAKNIVILDTVNQLSNNSELPSRYLCAILTSKLMNWFVYRFIFAKAIRTMHFDAPVSDRIPVPDANKDTNLKSKAEQIARLHQDRQSAQKELISAQTEAQTRRAEAKIASQDRRIDALVYEIYGLTDAEIALVETA